MDLPEIPECKKWKEKMTAEQEVMMKIQTGKHITRKEVEALDSAYRFYEKAFTSLKGINLTNLKKEEVPDSSNP